MRYWCRKMAHVRTRVMRKKEYQDLEGALLVMIVGLGLAV